MARLATIGFEPGEWHGATQPQFMSEDGDVMSASLSNVFNTSGSANPSDTPGYLGVGTAFFAPNNFARLALTTPPTTSPTYIRVNAAMLSSHSLTDNVIYGICSLFDVTSGGGGVGVGIQKGTSPGFSVAVTTSNVGGSDVRFISMPVTEGTYYRVEVMCAFTTLGGQNAWEVRVDGATIASGTNAFFTAAPRFVDLGEGGNQAGNSGNVDLDDFAWNDAGGASFNSWCGAGKVWYLTPTADSARGTNWVAGAGGTTSLFDALNIPGAPSGLATPTNTSQIKNAAMDTSGLYDATLPTYTAAGIPADHTISFCQVVCRGSGSATGMGLGIQCVSNPTIAETTIASLPVAANEMSATGWTTFRSAMAVNPTVTRGTAPVLRIRKTVSSSTAVYADQLWLLVETIPPVPPTPKPVSVYTRGAVQRAATWMKRRAGIVVPRLWTPADPVGA